MTRYLVKKEIDCPQCEGGPTMLRGDSKKFCVYCYGSGRVHEDCDLFEAIVALMKDNNLYDWTGSLKPTFPENPFLKDGNQSNGK